VTTSVDTLIHAGWIIPIEPENTVLREHSLAIRDGLIVDILPTKAAQSTYRAAAEHRLTQHVLCPGFVNAHTHAAMNLLRGIADDLPLMAWLQNHIWPAEGKWVNEEFVYDGTRLAIAEMLRSGTTCVNDMYFFPDAAARAYKESGIRASIGLVIIDFPTAWARNAQEYIDKGLALRDHYRSHPLITTALAPHAPYTVSDEPLKRIRVLADELDMPIHMHVHETADELDQSLQHHALHPLERLQRLGLLSPRFLAVHMTQLTAHEIKLVADTGTHVLHCPESNMKLASGICPVPALLDAGVNVALGTDGASSNNDLDMFGEMRSATLLAKVALRDATAVPAHRVLRMATLNGAKALWLDQWIGSLVPGKSADLIAINLNRIETQPVYHPISQLVYAASRDQVTDVWVHGKQLMNDRRLLTLDEQSILSKTQEWRQRIGGQ